MRPYLGPPWKPIHVKFGVQGFFFYYVLLKYGHENAEMQKGKFDDITLQYSLASRNVHHNFAYNASVKFMN